jgi:sulfite exporter TauE/SafE
MSQGRILAIAFIIIGAILALISVTADFFQGTIGAVGSGFGWKQLLGVVLGIVLIVAGIILLRQGDVEYEDDEEEEELEDEAQGRA